MPKKNPFGASDVVSRRGGPVKQPLSRDLIVREALRELSRSGAEGMSLRKIAQALETGAASLYVYVDDLESLQALVLDHALGAIDVSGGKKRGWRARLEAVLESYARVLFSTRGLAKLAFGTIAVGPNALRLLDALLGLLEEGGLDRASAAWAVDLFMLYVTAIAAERSSAKNSKDPVTPVAEAISRISASDYPHVYAARKEIISGTGEQRFGWAIDVLIDGVLRATRPSRKATQKQRAERGSRADR